MAAELLEIQPRELKLAVELNRQSSCSVQLINNSNHYVAFKVKTTSPRNYCVRPNVGIVLPKKSCKFTVMMRAQKIAPPDLQCKDKFLVQSTVVPFGTTEEGLNPNLFSKENGTFIEESKLRVVLVSPPHSSVLQPIDGALNQGPASEFIVLKESPLSKGSPYLGETPASKATPLSVESPKPRDQETSAPRDVLSGIENLHPSYVDKGVENLRAKLIELDSKLSEAEKSISSLLDEKHSTIQERDKLQQEVALLRRKCAAGVRVGFPLRFVCFIALVGTMLGFFIHS